MKTLNSTYSILLEKTGTLRSSWVWGDEVLAQGLAKALARSHPARVVSEDDIVTGVVDLSNDIVVYFRERFPKRLGRHNILWLQNARESFHANLSRDDWQKLCLDDQIAEFDAIGCASSHWASRVTELGGRGFYFPQFADVDVFRPSPPDFGVRLDLVYVSNNIKGEAVSREFLYPLCDYAAREGVRFSIYGGGWQDAERFDLVRPFWKGPAPSHTVPMIYSSSKIVLNLHMSSHRSEGVITSRIYEALACGARVMSDSVMCSDEFFEGNCRIFEDRNEMMVSLQELLAEPADVREAQAKAGREEVTRQHSANARAATLIEQVKILLGQDR